MVATAGVPSEQMTPVMPHMVVLVVLNRVVYDFFRTL